MVFDNFISLHKLFSKALQRLETCLLANYKLCRKLFLPIPITSDDNLIVPVALFVADFKLPNWESESQTQM